MCGLGTRLYVTLIIWHKVQSSGLRYRSLVFLAHRSSSQYHQWCSLEAAWWSTVGYSVNNRNFPLSIQLHPRGDHCHRRCRDLYCPPTFLDVPIHRSSHFLRKVEDYHCIFQVHLVRRGKHTPHDFQQVQRQRSICASYYQHHRSSRRVVVTLQLCIVAKINAWVHPYW
jgi:hypothetical protein